MTQAPKDIIEEFTRCLGTMSHSRAGWDYELPYELSAKEDRNEKQALSRARAIWKDNSDRHDDLRAAFENAEPLATMREIEVTP